MKPSARSGWTYQIRGKLLLVLPFLLVLQTGYLVLENQAGQVFEWSSNLIRVNFWSGFQQKPAGMQGEISPHAALVEGLNRWARDSSATMTFRNISQSAAGQDGTNLVTMSAEPANINAVGGALAITLVFSSGERIQEADVIFNPNPPKPWSTSERAETLNFFDVAVHEFGHMLGLLHTINRSSRMFFQGGAFGFGLNQNTWDDVAGINRLFPLPGIERITGSISGQVTRDGQGIFGAFVVAVDESGVAVASSISFPGGHYTIHNLPPGSYTVYAEPLDGPTKATNISGGIFSSAPLDSNFRPAFFEGTTDAIIRVNPGGVAGNINLRVASGRTNLDPEYLGTAIDPYGGIRVRTTTTRGHQDVSTNIVVAGKGVDRVDGNGLRILGNQISTGSISATRVHPNGTQFKFFPINIPYDAPAGPYPLVLSGGGELGVITGAIEIFPRFRFQQPFGQFAHLPGVLSSRLIVMNRSLADSTQTALEVRDLSGDIAGSDFEILSDGQNSRDALLSPGGSSSFRSSGSRALRGSLRSMSEEWPAASVILLDSEFGTTGMGPGPPLHSFITPVELSGHGTTTNTGIAVSNIDEREALLLLRLYDSNGVMRGEQTLELDGGAQTSSFVNELITVPYDPSGSFRGTVSVTANRRVTAAVIRTQPGVFTTLPVITSDVRSRRVFAQFAHSNSLTSELVLANPAREMTASQVRIQVRNTSGQATPVSLNGVFYPSGQVTVSIPPHGMTSFKTTQTDVVGWVEVQSDVPIGGVVLFSSSSLGTAGVGHSPISRRLVVPLERSEDLAMDMGVALVNAQGSGNSVTLIARDHQGNPAGSSRTIQLGPFEHLAAFVNESALNLGLPPDFAGSLWIDASQPVAVTAIRQAPGVLTTFPSFDRNLFLVPSLDALP